MKAYSKRSPCCKEIDDDGGQHVAKGESNYIYTHIHIRTHPPTRPEKEAQYKNVNFKTPVNKIISYSKF